MVPPSSTPGSFGIAPLGAKNKRKSAQRKAAFLAECLSQDVQIDTKTAEEAIMRSRNQHKKWWKIAAGSTLNGVVSKKRPAVTENGVVVSRERLSLDAPQETQYCHSNGSVKRKYHQSELPSPLGCSQYLQRGENSDIDHLRLQAIEELRNAKGDTTTPSFASLLGQLNSHHLRIDPSEHGSPHNGEWKLISGPSYHECEGSNDSGQAIYTLGRMSFDMFQPANLRCSMGRVCNTVEDIQSEAELPWAVRMIRQSNPNIEGLKRYDITAEIFIEVENDSSLRMGKARIPAIHVTRGYCMIDARYPDHLSIWFSSGSLLRDASVDVEDWQRIFKDCSSTRNFQTRAEMIARRVFLGAESHIDDEGNQHFKLHRPIGGFNKVFVDTIYADDSLRILRGNHGSILVFEREIENHYIASTA